MPLIASLLLSHWKAIALAMLLASAFAYRAVLIHQRDHALTKVAQLTAEAAALRESNAALGAAIARQNAAVVRLKTGSEAAVKLLKSQTAGASSAARVAANRAAGQARALERAPIDSKSGCDGAIKWGNAQAAELSAW